MKNPFFVRLSMILCASMGLIFFQNCSGSAGPSSTPSQTSASLSLTNMKSALAGTTSLLEVVGDPTGSDPKSEVLDSTLAFDCSATNIKDIVLNITSVTDAANQVVAVGLGAKNILSSEIEIPFAIDTLTTNLWLLLEVSGNTLIDQTDLAYSLIAGPHLALKIPLKLPGKTQFQGMTIYQMRIGLDPSYQISKTNDKCLINLVLRAASPAAVSP